MCFACMVLQVMWCLILDPIYVSVLDGILISALSQGQTLIRLPSPYQWPEPNGLTRSWKLADDSVQPSVANTPSCSVCLPCCDSGQPSLKCRGRSGFSQHKHLSVSASCIEWGSPEKDDRLPSITAPSYWPG